MNYYERIQKSLNYIECNLENPISLKNVAAEAFMSLPNFYKIFFAIVGYTVKEYIRFRRISFASEWLYDDSMKIIDIAVKCEYQSADAFSRSFRNITGFLPSEFRKQNRKFKFERIDVMDRYFEIQDQALLEKYPGIKVLKKLEPFRVASYIAYGTSPEDDALSHMRQWAERTGLMNENYGYRLFGFDVAESLKEDGSHGYEVWLSVPDGFECDDMPVKTVPGGLYAVTTTTIGDIEETWNLFREWLKTGKYDLGTHQWLEEHLPFQEWSRYRSQQECKIDLYMPITEKVNKQKEFINPVKVAYYRAAGPDREEVAMKAWNVMFSWARANLSSLENSKIYVYNTGMRKVKTYWQEVMITVDDDFEFTDKKVKMKRFPGGSYLSMKTTLPALKDAWGEMGRWMAPTKSKTARHQWIEEWSLQSFSFPETGIKVLYPISE